MVHYSLKPGVQIFVKVYVFCFLLKMLVKILVKISRRIWVVNTVLDHSK